MIIYRFTCPAVKQIFIEKVRRFTFHGPTQIPVQGYYIKQIFNLSKYITSSNNTDYVFRNVVYIKKTNQYTLGTKAVSCTRFRKRFKECLKTLSRTWWTHAFAVNSFRAGGTTEILKNLQTLNQRKDYWNYYPKL